MKNQVKISQNTRFNCLNVMKITKKVKSSIKVSVCGIYLVLLKNMN